MTQHSRTLTIPYLGIIMPFMGMYADALFTKTQQRVLAVLFSQPQRSFYANEIIGLAACGSGAVQRELARMEATGLVTTQRRGNQKHYQANAAAPIYQELRGIVVKTFGIADLVRAALQPLWPHIALAFIYGSIAKGTEHAASDIDVMVVGDISSHSSLLEALAPTEAELGRVINPTLYTEDEFKQRFQAKKIFLLRVLEQPKIMIKGGDDDISRLCGTGESGAHWPT